LVGHVDFEGSRWCKSFLLKLASLQSLYELPLHSFFDAL
jgi:hypothetical protein